MKKIFICFSLFMFLFVSCNQDDGNSDGEGTTENDEEVKKDSKMAAAASGACKCMSAFSDELSDRTKKIIIKASKSNNMEGTFEAEFKKISDPEEQEQVSKEMQQMSQMGEDNEMKECMEKVKKKHKLKDSNKTQQQALLKELKKKKGCEVTAALMQIGFSQTSNESASDDDDM